ncbi:MAG: putative phage tail protein [Peptococcaceae bacterium]|nr:putative phage tail protein [Peptococcaceae bacterium]
MVNRIAERLDPRLDKITHFHELTEAESVALDKLDDEVKELEANMTLTNTTLSQIARREAEFGVASDNTKPIVQRRAVLIAKLRGQGTTTPALIRNVAASFEYGEVSVDESSAPYTVRIIFESVIGIPPNMEDFIRTIEEVKPAHLVFEYVYRYNTWDMIEAFEKTWDEWEALDITFEGLMTYHEDDTETTSIAKSVANTLRKAVQNFGQRK